MFSANPANSVPSKLATQKHTTAQPDSIAASSGELFEGLFEGLHTPSSDCSAGLTVCSPQASRRARRAYASGYSQESCLSHEGRTCR